MPSGDVPVCYNNDSSTLTCMTTEGSLLWIYNDSMSRLINRLRGPAMLENLTISVVSVVANGTSLSVTSTATITNFRFFSSMSNCLTVRCREISTSITEQSTFIKAGKGNYVLYELLETLLLAGFHLGSLCFLPHALLCTSTLPHPSQNVQIKL